MGLGDVMWKLDRMKVALDTYLEQMENIGYTRREAEAALRVVMVVAREPFDDAILYAQNALVEIALSGGLQQPSNDLFAKRLEERQP